MAKKRSTGFRPFITLAILLMVAAGLWSILQQDQDTKTTGGREHKYEVQKTGAGITVDFIKAGRELDDVIIRAVKGSGFKNIAVDRARRQAPRQQVEGFIVWENRHITLAVPPAGKPDSFIETLSRVVGKSGGRIFASYQDSIEGKQALRLDVGFEDVLEEEPVIVVTHNIWLIMQADTPVVPPTEEGETPVSGPYPHPPQQEKSQGNKLPPTEKLGRLALVIDDFGLTMAGVTDLMALDQPLTFAVLPYHPYSATIARQAADAGKEVLLHLPLESTGGERAERTTIITTLTEAQIKTRTREALGALPRIIGVNNHQGSKATADVRVMQAVLAVLREQDMFFLDSRTSAGSIAYRTAKNMGLPAAENDHFIDNSADVETIKHELRTAGRLAISQGEAVAIGHIRPHTVTAIREMLPELEHMGVKLVFVSELAR